MGILWSPLLFALPLFAVAAGALVYESALGGLRASVAPRRGGRLTRTRMRLVIAVLYLLQPVSRLGGRLRFGLAPWRRRGGRRLAVPRPRISNVWSEHWASPDARLRRIEAELQQEKCVVARGGDFERWDLQVRGGGLGSARMRMGVEDHGGGRQLLRFRIWPRCSRLGLGLVTIFTALATSAAIDGTWIGAIVLGGAALLIGGSMMHDCAAALGVLVPAVEHNSDEPRPALDVQPSDNGAEPAGVPIAARLVPRVTTNGGSPNGAGLNGDRQDDVVQDTGAMGAPTPIRMRRHGLNVTEREE
jgi:hypothetical protein